MSAGKKRQPSAQKSSPIVKTETPRWLLYVSAATILAVYIALRLPGIGVPLDRDEGAFGHMGQLIHHGGLPYRDGLDHKPPIAFYINALALYFVPPTERGIHVFLFVYNFLTLICLFYLARIYFGSLSAGLWSAFAYAVFSASPAIQGFTASTEMWSLLPITVGLLLAVLGRRNKSLAMIFLSGVAGAVGCWTKQTVFTSVLFVLLYVGIEARAESPFGDPSLYLPRWFREVLAWLGGAILFSVAVVAYFAARGALHEFIYWCFLYGVSYVSQASFGATTEALQYAIVDIFRGDFVLLCAGIPVAIWGVVRGQRWAYFILGFLLLSFLGVIPGFGYRHYFAQLAPPVALASGQGFSMLTSRVGTWQARSRVAVCCVLASVLVPIAVNSQYFLERDPNAISRHYFGLNPFPESKPVADFIARNTGPDDRVLIIGSEPQILFCAQRRSSSAFLMIYPLMVSHPRYKEFQRQMLDEVQRNPPKYIVAIHNLPFSFAWDGVADPEILRSLDTIINGGYTLERLRVASGTQGNWIDPGSSHPDPEAPLLFIFRRKT
jgi:hypothetical protein